MKQQDNYKVGIYCRLSKDDYNEGESSSITSQKSMLTAYVQEKGWDIVGYYVDDGVSGLTFQRPDFIRMINDIDMGKIDLVITKDMSRLGRDYIMTGHYVEVYFPSKNVRYIGLNDGIDTIHDNDMTPFKAVINELYAKDISKKIRSSMKQRSLRGEYLGGYPPYGFIKDPADKHHLLVDEGSAPTIKRIFELFLLGHGAQNISTTLNKEGRTSPIDRLKELHPGMFKAEKWYSSRPFQWKAPAVCHILRNPAYVGHMVNCRQTTKSFKCKDVVRNDPKDWIVVENTHEAIIDKETFDKAQKILAGRRTPTKQGEPHIFHGLLKCPDCGMSFTLSYAGGNSYKTFYCRTYKGQGINVCGNHNIRYDKLYDIVLDDIRYHAKLATLDKDKLMQKLSSEDLSKRDKQVKAWKAEVSKLTRRETEINDIIAKLYEDKINGVLSEARFLMLTQKYDGELLKIEDRKREVKEALVKEEIGRKDTAHWVEIIRKYTNISELTKELVHDLIDVIYIGKKEYINSNNATQDIRICYKFVGDLG